MPASGQTIGISATMFLLTLVILEWQAEFFSSTAQLRIIAGFISSTLYFWGMMVVGNIETDPSWFSVALCISIAMFVGSTIHPVCITTSFLFSIGFTLYLVWAADALYRNVLPPSFDYSSLMSSMKMLRPKLLPKVLAQANTAGVKTTLLINGEGSLLAFAGADIGNDAVAAIVSNIWTSTEESDSLEFVILECEEGKVVVMQISEVFLCLIGSEMAEFGMLKAKICEIYRNPTATLDVIIANKRILHKQNGLRRVNNNEGEGKEVVNARERISSLSNLPPLAETPVVAIMDQSSFLPSSQSASTIFSMIDVTKNQLQDSGVQKGHANANLTSLSEISKGIYKLKRSKPTKETKNMPNTINTLFNTPTGTEKATTANSFSFPSFTANSPQMTPSSEPSIFPVFYESNIDLFKFPTPSQAEKSPFPLSTDIATPNPSSISEMDNSFVDFSSDVFSDFMEETETAGDSNSSFPLSSDYPASPGPDESHEEYYWTYQREIGTETVEFLEASNLIIETAFRERQPYKTFFDTTLKSTVTIFFDSLALQVAQTNETFHVQRAVKKHVHVTPVPVNKFNQDQWFQIQYPPEWESQRSVCELKIVSAASEEFLRIKAEIGKTMPWVKKISIKRIQNQHLWRRYYFERQFVEEKNANGHSNEMELFHGTRATCPIEIYNGEEGFDMRHSKTGMWGVGIYFASSAAYSHNYAYNDIATNSKQFFYTRVATGSSYFCVKGDPSLRTPPKKESNYPSLSRIPFAIDFYDSVLGMIGTTKIYTVYSNSKAYPSYLISIENNDE